MLYPLEHNPDLDRYHVYGNRPGATCQYFPATYHGDTDGDLNPDHGGREYHSASCTGRSHADAVYAEGGLRVIPAYGNDGACMDAGVLYF